MAIPSKETLAGHEIDWIVQDELSTINQNSWMNEISKSEDDLIKMLKYEMRKNRGEADEKAKMKAHIQGLPPAIRSREIEEIVDERLRLLRKQMASDFLLSMQEQDEVWTGRFQAFGRLMDEKMKDMDQKMKSLEEKLEVAIYINDSTYGKF